MDLTKLFELIEKEKANLNNIINIQNKEIEFFEEVISNNNFSSIKGLISINCPKVMAAYLCTISNELGIEQIYNLIIKTKILINTDSESIRKLSFECLDLLKDNSNDILTKISKKHIKKMLDQLDIDNYDFEAASKLDDIYDDSFIKATALFTSINDLKENYFNIRDDFDDFKNTELIGIRVSSKKKEEILKEQLDYNYNISNISQELSKISSYYQKIRREDNNSKKRARKSIANYTNLVKVLNSLSNNKLLDKYIINNILNLIDNEEIQKEFLYQLNIEHQKYFETLNTKYQKLSQNSKISIQVLFKKYEIDFNKLPKDLKNKILKLKVEELEPLLKSIKELGITSYEMICYVLYNSNIEVINNYINLIIDGIITKKFILDHLELLSINSEQKSNYNNTIEKLKLFQSNGINCRIFINDLNIYLVEYKKLLYNINTLKQYNLLVGINKLNSFELLKDNNLENKIDLFLELGYERILEDNLLLLNFEINKIKKLYILKNMGLLPNNINDLINIMNNSSFLDCIQDVDNYIFNIVDYRINNSIITNKKIDLNKYFSFNDNTRVIELNGIILSKNRIKRNILKLEDTNLSEYNKTIYSLIYGSILSEEEYNSIISNLNSIGKRPVK